jgi:hypothetical protein
MREDLRHSDDNTQAQKDKVEFGDGKTERTALRAKERFEKSKGVKNKYLGNKNPFKK